MQKERDDAMRMYQDLTNEHVKIQSILSGFEVLGFKKPDDITHLLNEHHETITGINKQLLEVLRRNQVLAKMVQDKESEDSTAIDEGLKAMQDARELHSAILEISKKTGTKPNLFDIIDKIESLKSHAGRFFTRSKEELDTAHKKAHPTDQRSGMEWLLDMFGLRKGGVQS